MSNKVVNMLAWAFKINEGVSAEDWALQNSNTQVFISIKKGELSHVDENGALIYIGLCNGQLVRKPIVIDSRITKNMASRQFQLVLPGNETRLRVMWTMLAFISHQALKNFYWAVLSDDKIMSKFYRAKASQSHHHCHAGGLFEHSVEVASSAFMNVRQNRLGELTSYIAFVSGLLHDIGKIEMYYNTNAKKGAGCQHEALAFMVLSEQLAELKKVDEMVFEAISNTLTAKIGSARNEYLSETIVRMCDRISADANRTRQVFKGKPAHYWYVRSARDKRVFKRLDEA